MLIQIKNRFTAAVIFEGEYESLRLCVLEAVKARAYLADANLAGADLARADLTDAYLARANLAGADLAGANLTDAYLARANLADANLAGANLAGAYLTGAYLTGADLARANLAGAYLAGADLTGARNVPTDAQAEPAEPYERKPAHERYAERAARFRERNPEVPVVVALDAKLLTILDSGRGKLRMDQWHTCKTTHCRAGWAVTLAGDAGKALEDKHGSQRAGTLIYRASTGRVPHFFASDERALEDIREQAATQRVDG